MRFAAVVVVLAACNPYDADLGSTPFLCAAAEPRCPRDYTCIVDPEDGREVCSDTLPPEFICADDSSREPNQEIAEATATPIDATATFVLAGAICPAGDVDVYALELSADAAVEVIVKFQGDGADLEATILDPGGAPLAGAAPLEDDPTTIRALASFLSAGPYFVQVKVAEASFLELNNYTVTINVNP